MSNSGDHNAIDYGSDQQAGRANREEQSGRKSVQHYRPALRKDPRVTVVRVVGPGEDDTWYVGGTAQNTAEPLAELSIVVTKGTNTDDEKADWIREVETLLCTFLGHSSQPRYISVVELDNASWGYGGLTQQQRHTPVPQH